MTDGVIQIPLELIDAIEIEAGRPGGPDRGIGEDNEVAETAAAPLIVRRGPKEGRYLLLSGRRALDVAKRTGRERASCRVVERKPKQSGGARRRQTFSSSVLRDYLASAPAWAHSGELSLERLTLMARLARSTVEILAPFDPSWRTLAQLGRVNATRQVHIAKLLAFEEDMSFAFARSLVEASQPEDFISRRRSGRWPDRKPPKASARPAEEHPWASAQSRQAWAKTEIELILLDAFARKIVGSRPVARYIAAAHPMIFQILASFRRPC